EFLLLGFSDALGLQILHLATFLIIYLAALIGNLLVITLIAVDSHLHTPMYFFLLNLSILDIGSISVIVPKSMANSILKTRLISYSGCVTQAFFFLFFITADLAILTIMAYDRYIAICKPLHYATVMNRRACLQMAATTWSTTLLYSALHTGNTFRLPFCHSNIVNQFFCEVPQLLRISGSEVFTSEIQILISSACLGLVCIAFIFVSYIQIFTTVMRVPSEQGRHKAVSTCLPHLIVVSLLGSTGLIAYVKPTSESPSALDLIVSVLYSMIPPMMNPVIYSMRNKDIKAALW
ncbi:olfactory receptor 14I1-like, partial [Alligator mississippiensis]|uniref:olfactory receptor 14I1-like n=1 Tax=Alligator mississippiensis TaxID=8496 RepID=UPI0028773641